MVWITQFWTCGSKKWLPAFFISLILPPEWSPYQVLVSLFEFDPSCHEMNATPRTNAGTTSGIDDLVCSLAGTDIQMGWCQADGLDARYPRTLCGVVAERRIRTWKCHRTWSCTFTRAGKVDPVGGEVIGNMAETGKQAGTIGKQRVNDQTTSWFLKLCLDGSFQVWNRLCWTCQATADFHASNRPPPPGPRTISGRGTR